MLLSRCFRMAVLSLVGMASAVCLAQSKAQFMQPQVEETGGRVMDFIPGNFEPSGLPDILYINAPTGSGASLQVLAGLQLNKQGFTNLKENQVTFANTANAVAALGDFDGDGHSDIAFALSPTVAGGSDLCVFYGTGVAVGFGVSLSPLGAKSGCASFPVTGSQLPKFNYVAAEPFRTGVGNAQVILEDSANNMIYVVTNDGSTGTVGSLPGFRVLVQYAIPAVDGAGPIVTGDFNGDGNQDFIVNGQVGNSASIYFGNGDGTFKPPVRYTFDHNVHSMLLSDMDGDGLSDMVVEGDRGIIEIFKGSADGSFAVKSMGGTSQTGGADGFFGNGGHLVAVGKLGRDANLDILTATPVGLSVLQGQANLTYALRGIYNVGPGRAAYALADFDGDGYLDVAVDSPEGVVLVNGASDGSLQTSLAYAAGMPALNAVVGNFGGAQSSSAGPLDVAVATSYAQGKLLVGDGAGEFAAVAGSTNPTSVSNPGNLWTLLQAGDFDGDGNLDLAYTATGFPLPYASTRVTGGLTIGYGLGFGAFSGAVTPASAGVPGDNNFFGQSVVADFNGDGIADLANVDARYDDTLLGQRATAAVQLGLNVANYAGEPNSLNQVAAGFFASGRTSKPDLVFQHDADLIPYRNSGDGIAFAAMPKLSGTPSAATLVPATVLLADVDGDGKGDVVATYYNLAATPADPSSAAANALYIWYGNGDGTFGAPQVLTLSRNYYLAQVVDLNGDGLPDVVLSDGYLVAILYNQGGRSFGTVLPSGELSSEQHFLAGQGINSLSLADVNGDGALDLIVANGGVTISNALAMGALAKTSVALTPNPDVNTGGITVLLNSIKTKAVTGTLTASPDPSGYGASFTLNATLVPTAGVATPTGTVTFYVSGAQVGTAAVGAGAGSSTASYTIPAGNTYRGSTLALAAAYSGDAANSPVTLYGTQATAGGPTTTTLLLCVGPSVTCPSVGPVDLSQTPQVPAFTIYYGQTFNGSTMAAANDGSALTGVIDFDDTYNGVPSTLCTLSVAMGSACPNAVGVTIGTSVGTNVFTSTYTGDTTHLPSTSNTITITVLQDTNSATLAGAPNPSPVGQPVTFTATFTGNAAAPVGTVTFAGLFPPSASPVPLGTATLVPGLALTSTATFTTTSLPVGTDTITASYAATQDFAFAAATTTETILPLVPATTTIASSLNPSTVGQAVTFTATVSAGSGNAVPTGTVTFTDGGTTLGVATITVTGTATAGLATFTTSALAVGSHTITANYSGNAVEGASSASLVQVVNAVPTGSFTVTVAPSPVTVGVGGSATLLVTVTAMGGYAQAVNLGCSGLPTESACTFAMGTIPVGGGQTQLLLTTIAPHSCGTTQPYFVGGNDGGNGGTLPLVAPVLAGLLAIFVPGRRRWLRGLMAMVAVAGLTQMTGCGNCTDLGTRPNTYTIRVTGTAAAGAAEVESAPVVFTVTL